MSLSTIHPKLANSRPNLTPSLAQIMITQEGAAYEEFVRELEEVAQLNPSALVELQHDWKFWGRPSQWEPKVCETAGCECNNRWSHWMIMAGRAWGKTRTGSETIHDWAETHPGCRIACIAPTAADARDVMIEGDSGLLATSHPDRKPIYQPSNRRLIYPCKAHRKIPCPFGCSHTMVTVFSADEPERFRGPQHHFYWADEIAAWKYVEECWSNLNMGLRLTSIGRVGWPAGFRPRGIITTTPRPTPFIRNLVRKANVHLTVGSTYENAANLASEFFSSVLTEFEGTRLGQQELDGVLLEDIPGALFKSDMLEQSRVKRDVIEGVRMTYVVAIDPATSSQEGSDHTGIVVCAAGPAPGEEGDYDDGTAAIGNTREDLKRAMKRLAKTHGYVVHDGSIKGTPKEWAHKAIDLYYQYGASCIVAESNQGGEMVRDTLRSVDDSVPIKLVHATKNKQTRAEPIVSLFEQRRAHLVGGFPDLEKELTTWDPEISRKSPDRLDAMVWGLHHLLVKNRPRPSVHPQPVNPRPNPWAIFTRNED